MEDWQDIARKGKELADIIYPAMAEKNPIARARQNQINRLEAELTLQPNMFYLAQLIKLKQKRFKEAMHFEVHIA